jgi:glycosyltransferase involved in cell wall biosynthesis
MMTPFVSIITIFLNAEAYLEEAIQSILDQTCGNWELLLVDDGSTDRSTRIAQKYSNVCPEKIQYLEHAGHANRGMSASRNWGFAHASGDLIAFLDADDLWLPQKLATQTELLRLFPEASMICGPSIWWQSWRSNGAMAQPDTLRTIGITPRQLIKPPELLIQLPLDRVKTPATCSTLIRRELFQEVGGFEESFRGMYEDQAFFAKVFLKGTIYATEEPLDRYRQHPDSCCAMAEKRNEYHPRNPNAAHAAFLHWLEAYCVAQRVIDPRLWRNLNQALWPYRHPVLSLVRKQWHRVRRKSRTVLARATFKAKNHSVIQGSRQL